MLSRKSDQRTEAQPLDALATCWAPRERGVDLPRADCARRPSGFEPDADIEVVFTGLTPGEKLHEELVSDGEEVVPTHHDRIRVLRAPERQSQPEGWLATLEDCVATGDVARAAALLRALVPSYCPSAAMSGAFPALEDRSTPRVA